MRRFTGIRRLSRRQFLTTSAVTAGAALLAAKARSSSGQPSASGTTGTIADVKHVVVLMQENRSFDHYFGSLRGVRGFDDRSTIILGGRHSVFEQPHGSTRQPPFALRDTRSRHTPETVAQCQADLPHSWADQHAAWNLGKLDRWIEAKGSVDCMGYLDRRDLPFHYALADSYTICDAYHCSALSATGPNRTFLWSGMIDAAGRFGEPLTNGGDASGLTWQTYAEGLERAGITWRVYQDATNNYGDNGLAYFKQFADAPKQSVLHRRGMGDVPRVTQSTPRNIIEAIRADVLAGELPQVSWVVTDQITSEHPVGPPVNGARFIYELLQALQADPATFDSTVVFINYDENDGFFDHVPPPIPPPGTPDELVDGVAIGLGFRVPMLVVSPWTRGGWVCSEVFDHTSVLRFLERWSEALGRPVRCRYISTWRRSVCGDLTSAFDFSAPVYGMPVLPQPGASIDESACRRVGHEHPVVTRKPVQEAGTRPARVLPYQPNASVTRWERSDPDKLRLWITMSNEGERATSAAHFAVYANAYRSGGPWQYTVPAYDAVTQRDGRVEDFFNVGRGYGDGLYDFTVVGPNRFLRRLTGDAHGRARQLEVTSSYQRAPHTGELALWLELKNDGTEPVSFTIATNAYVTDGPWRYVVKPRHSVSDYFDAVGRTQGWYDLTVTADLDARWSRRFVGHLETGKPSVSG